MIELKGVVLPIEPLISIGLVLVVVKVKPKPPLIFPVNDKVPVFLIVESAPKVIFPEYVAVDPLFINAPIEPVPVPLRVNASAVAKV